MRAFFKGLSALLIAVILLAASASAATQSRYDSKLPHLLSGEHLTAEAAVLIDGATGKVLFEKNAYQRMYPASTTKILTVLLALESGIDLRTPVIVPQQAGRIPSDSTLVPVFPGDQLPFGDLLYGCMLASGNDAANAVAVLVAGSLDAFVERMNKRAAELGCEATHFVNAHGYHDDQHYTTAMDMARIAQAAMNNDRFREICACQKYTFTIRREGEDVTPTRTNSNAMLNPDSDYFYQDCIGIKTGTHSMAGNCFVGAAERDGVRLISVTLKSGPSNQRWTDATRLFNFGFTCYDSVSLEQLFVAAGDKIGTVKISNAAKDDAEGGNLNLRIAQISNADYTRMVEKNSDEALEAAVEDFVSRTTMTVTHNMVAPVSAGEIMGQLRYVSQSGEEITALLIAGRDVKERPKTVGLADYFPFIERFKDPLVQALLLVLAALIVLLILVALIRKSSKQRRRAQVYRVRKREALQAERAENRRRRELARRKQEERRAKWERRRKKYDDDYDDYDDDYDDDDYDDGY